MSESYIEKLIPFICNMRVQAEESEEPVVSLVPFDYTDILKNGQSIIFDLSKDVELGTFLASLEYESAPLPILTAEAENDMPFMLNAYKLDEDFYILFTVAQTGSGPSDMDVHYVYSTQEATEEEMGMDLDKGYQKSIKDNNGVLTITLAGDSVIKNIDDPNNQWNGIIIGKGE